MAESLPTGTNKSIIQKIFTTTSMDKEIECQFYVPVNKINKRSITYQKFVANGNRRIVETEYGSIEVRNRLLTERHKEIVNSVIKNSQIQVMPDGNFCAMYKFTDVLKELNMGNNTAQLKEDLKQIQDAMFVIKFGSKEKTMRIFTKTYTDNETGMQIAILDRDYVLMYKHNFSANYKKLQKKISDIPYPALKTIVHYLIVKSASEDEEINSFLLSNVLNKIGFPVESPASVKEVRKNLKLYSNELKKHFNIDYDPNLKTFTTKKHENVKILEPIEDIGYKNYIGKYISFSGKKYQIQDIVELPKNKWIIVTEIEKIELYFYKDDFLFMLNVVTSSNDDVKQFQKKQIPSLFDQ